MPTYLILAKTPSNPLLIDYVTAADPQAAEQAAFTELASGVSTNRETILYMLIEADVSGAIAPNQNPANAQLNSNTNTANLATILQQAATALTNNTTYLGIASPTNAQVVAQVAALTRQMDGVIRVLVQNFAGTT